MNMPQACFGAESHAFSIDFWLTSPEVNGNSPLTSWLQVCILRTGGTMLLCEQQGQPTQTFGLVTVQ